MRRLRTQDVIGGVLLVLLGAWGGLIPFVGPTFNFGFRPDKACELTEGRLYLSLLPGVATVTGGLLLALGGSKLSRITGALLALCGGAWFVMGSQMSRLWNDGRPELGAPIDGGAGTLEQLTFFAGLGALVVAVSAILLGRLMGPRAPAPGAPPPSVPSPEPDRGALDEPPEVRQDPAEEDTEFLTPGRLRPRKAGDPLWPPGQWHPRD